jgi:uncharacterized protein DUF2505
MARSFDFSVESSVSVVQIHAAFADEDYWLARIAAFGGTGRLDSFAVGVDGSIRVVIIQDLRNDLMPGFFAKLYPRDLAVVQDETWTLVDGGLVRGEVSTAARGAPGSGSGTLVMVPARDGSRLNCTATVRVKVPLVGGKIESLAGRQMVEETPVMVRFTAKWITDNA